MNAPKITTESDNIEPLPTIVTIPSPIVPDYKSTISDLTINSFTNYMKLPEQNSLMDFTKSSIINFTKNQTVYGFNQLNWDELEHVLN